MSERRYQSELTSVRGPQQIHSSTDLKPFSKASSGVSYILRFSPSTKIDAQGVALPAVLCRDSKNNPATIKAAFSIPSKILN